MLWLCNFKKKKKTTNVVLKQRNINKKTNPPASSLSVNLHRLQSNVSHRLRSYASHRLQSHDSQFMLSGSSTKKKSSRPETLAGTLMAKKIPLSGMTTMTKTKKEKLKFVRPAGASTEYPTFSISQRRGRRSQQCLHPYRRTSDGRS